MQDIRHLGAARHYLVERIDFTVSKPPYKKTFFFSSNINKSPSVA